MRFGHLLRERALGPGLLVYWPTDDLDAGDLWAPVIRMACGGKYRNWVFGPRLNRREQSIIWGEPIVSTSECWRFCFPPFWNAIMFAAIRVHESGHQYGEEAESTSE